MKKVKRILVHPLPDNNEIWEYRVNWIGDVTVSKEETMYPNVALESLYEQEMWGEFLNLVGVRNIELDLFKLEEKLRYLQVVVPLTERDAVLIARSRLKEAFTKIARMRNVEA